MIFLTKHFLINPPYAKKMKLTLGKTVKRNQCSFDNTYLFNAIDSVVTVDMVFYKW